MFNAVPLSEQLQQYFGFSQFRDGQREVVEALVNGHSAMAIFPTGSGKSLCYQLAALQMPHLTLVISPLLALMRDQLAFLHSKGIRAAAIDSSQSREETQQVMQDIQQGELKILMVSVERLKNERFRRFIGQVSVSLLVIDEAHCISEWGHNFRPDYLKLPDYKKELNIPQALLLTATATPAVIQDMASKFAIRDEHVTVTGFYRSNLHLHIRPVDSTQKDATLIHLLEKTPNAPCVVYVTQQQTAETVADKLQAAGIHATAYHAGLDNLLRQQIQDDFMQGKSQVIVATIAFGMGIDKSDIRQVIHYDLPKSVENYSQEIGRAGRDGKKSLCTLLGSQDGLNLLKNFVYGDTPEQASIAKVLKNIVDEAGNGQWEMTLFSLSSQSNIRQLPLKTLLVYLNMQGKIKPLYSYYSEYRFVLQMSEADLLGHFNSDRREFIATLLKHSKLARTWYSFNFVSFLNEFPDQRQRAVAALEYLDEASFLRLETKQMTDVFQVLSPIDPAPLSLSLYQQFNQKEQNELNRLSQMLALFESTECLSHTLANYFGDAAAPTQCGHCSVCHGKPATLPPAPELVELERLDLNAMCQDLISKAGKPLSAHLLSCFLCGITLPHLTKYRASKMTYFGKLADYPFAEVRAALLLETILPTHNNMAL